MTITVGTDTYISLADADTYIAANYASTDTQRVAWEALSDADKEVYLRKATQAIDSLRIQGAKYDLTQALQFPRDHALAWPVRREYMGVWPPYDASGALPTEVISAQVEEALELASPSAASDKLTQTTRGVSEFSIGHFSAKVVVKDTANLTPETVLASIKAQQLIQRFVSGGYALV